MCVTDVGRVVAISEDGGTAELEGGGARRAASLAVLVLEGSPVQVGDWVRVHTGLAVEVIGADEAERVLELRASLGS